MELNITRQQVCTNELCFNQSVEQSLDFDVNLPDYYGEIQKILRSSLVPRISSKSVSGQTLTIDGNACFNIVYLDENGKICSYEQMIPFAKNIDLGASFENCNISAQAKCSYLNAKASNQRRIVVHGVVDIQLRGCCKKASEIICDIDNPEVFVNRGEAPSTSLVNCVEKNTIIDEKLELGPSQHSVENILRHNAVLTLINHKIINDKVIVKGELALDILYTCVNDAGIEKFSATVPFSQILDVDGVTEDCECDISMDIASFELKPCSAYDGDVRAFSLDAKICITACAVCNNNVAVIYDAYSPKVNLNLKNENTVFEKMIDKISENFTCKKKLEFSDGDISNIIDMWSNCALQGYRCEDNDIIFTGTVTVCMFAKNQENDINYFERPIDFECRCAVKDMPQNIKCQPQILCKGSSYTLVGNNSIDVQVVLDVSASLYEIKQINILTDIQIPQENVEKCANECSLMVYFANEGESVWDIAKRFNASPSDIMSVNSVGEIIDCNKMLLVSC